MPDEVAAEDESARHEHAEAAAEEQRYLDHLLGGGHVAGPEVVRDANLCARARACVGLCVCVRVCVCVARTRTEHARADARDGIGVSGERDTTTCSRQQRSEQN